MTGKPARLLAAAVACLAACAALATAASASPVWKFNGVTLVGSETVLNHDLESSFTIPGLTTTCKPFVYRMTIENVGGTGVASITEMPLTNCFTNSKFCAVESFVADGLPWSATLKTISTSHYLVTSGVKLTVVYSGALCALSEIEVPITGSAGGLIVNSSESTKYDASTFSATGTALKVFGEGVEWSGLFTMIATGAHVGESLSVG